MPRNHPSVGSRSLTIPSEGACGAHLPARRSGHGRRLGLAHSRRFRGCPGQGGAGGGGVDPRMPTPGLGPAADPRRPDAVSVLAVLGAPRGKNTPNVFPMVDREARPSWTAQTSPRSPASVAGSGCAAAPHPCPRARPSRFHLTRWRGTRSARTTTRGMAILIVAFGGSASGVDRFARRPGDAVRARARRACWRPRPRAIGRRSCPPGRGRTARPGRRRPRGAAAGGNASEEREGIRRGPMGDCAAVPAAGRMVLRAGRMMLRRRKATRAVGAVANGPSHAPERIRTSDLRLRRPTLYPAELRARLGEAGKPSSVSRPRPRGGSSLWGRRCRRPRAAYPGLCEPAGSRGAGHASPPTWPCSGWGLPCRSGCPEARWALTPPFHPCLCPARAGPSAVCSLWPCPSPCGARGLPGTLPYGARTFLDPTPEPERGPRPTSASPRSAQERTRTSTGLESPTRPSIWPVYQFQHLGIRGAPERTRTSTGLRPRDPESRASTNSATGARLASAPPRSRTWNLGIKSPLLYQLS